MDCDTLRAVILVYGDGKRGDDAVRAHLSGCAGCRAWDEANDSVASLVAAASVEGGDPVPDDARIAQPTIARIGLPRRFVVRGALAGVGVAQIVIAVLSVIHVFSASAHGSHELASLDIALGVGFLTAASRPWRSAGLVPLAGVAAALLWITAMGDIADGETAFHHELPHLLAVAGFVLLALAVRPPGHAAARLRARSRQSRRPSLRVIRAVASALH
jgi:predicted anti-sigma-YlaC factor YlaD